MISLSLPSSPAKIPLPSPKPTNHPSRQKPPSSTTFKPQNSSFYSLKDRLFHHLNAGHLQKAISTLDQMSQQGTHPDLITYSLLLKSCIRSHNYQLGHLVHHRLTQSGLELDSVILNSLISLYSKCGDWQQAHEIFESMGNKRDLVSWSALISCYANNEKEFEATSAFFDMLECGFYPNEYCFTGVFRACSNKENISLGEIIFGFLLKTGYFESDVCVGCALIDMFVKGNGDLESAYKVFDRMPDRNVVSWSALMTGYLLNGFSLKVIRLLKDMISEGNVSPNEYIFAIAISSCCDRGRVEEGRQCHGLLLKTGFSFHNYVRNALVSMYSKCSIVQDAMGVWNEVPVNDIVAYNSILSRLVENGYLREGLEVLRSMVSESVKWDKVTFVNAFSLCAYLKDLRLGLHVHGKMLTSDVECDAYVSSAIINMYGKCGKSLMARGVFDGLQSRNVVLWTAVMASYFQNGCFEEALNLFSKMEQENVKSNEFTYAVLLNACAGLSARRNGSLLHGHSEKSGFKHHVMVGNALINMYAKSGDIEAAKKVFSDMMHRDIITWNAMICGFSHHGLGKKALLVFQDMLAAEEHPNYVTFTGVLSACGHQGLVQEGFYYLHQLMKQFGVQPGLEHYTCIVSLLSKRGQLNEARNFMRTAPVKWDVVAWRTLLNACHVHQNYGLGRWVAEFVLEMDPNDVGTYTLLSNIYAKEKRWDGVVKVRKLMRDKKIKKEPGVSWIEIGNVTHIFTSEDNKHPDYGQTYQKVKELLAMIKPLGYTPDIGAVLHDVEDEQKEYYLSYHSEKLAIAYGLLKLPSEASILVIKNLRICDDCHSAVRLISKVTNRVIVVRDANRFHHFRDGRCSCLDYW